MVVWLGTAGQPTKMFAFKLPRFTVSKYGASEESRIFREQAAERPTSIFFCAASTVRENN